MVQWLRFHALNAGGLGSISAQGTRSHMLQLRVHMLQVKIPQVSIKKKKRRQVKIPSTATKIKDPECHN